MSELPPDSQPTGDVPPDQPGAPGPGELGAELAVASRLAADHGALIEFLAGTLQAQIPAAVRVHRKGLFNVGNARKVTVTLGDVHYELSLEGGRLSTTTGKVVGGVALHHDEIPVDQWVAGLLATLRTMSVQSAEIRTALANLT